MPHTNKQTDLPDQSLQNTIETLKKELEQKERDLQELQQLLEDSLLEHVHFDSFKKLKDLTDQKIETLNRVIRHGVTLIESYALNDILSTLLDDTMEILELDKAAIFVIKKVGKEQRLKIVDGRGISPETRLRFSLRIGEGLAGWCYYHDQSDLAYDVSRDHRFKVRKGHKKRRESMIVIPIRIDNIVHGVLCAEKILCREALLTRNEFDYLTIMTNFAAAAFKNARIYQRLQKRHEESFLMLEVSEAITSTLNLDEVLDLILENLSKIIGVHRCSIMLLDSQREYLKVRAAHGFGTIDTSRKINMGEGIAGCVAKTGQPLLIEDIDNHPMFKKTGGGMYRSKSLLSVPIRYKEKTIGVLNMTNKQDEKAFTEVEQRLVSYYADQVSIAIENANLYTQVEQMATTDSLTGLVNHRIFQDRLNENFRKMKQSGQELSLIMADVDSFKKINDSYGHLFGDDVLREIGNVLLRLTHKNAIASRYGGEEFAVILPAVPEKQAFDLAEQIRHQVKEQHFEAQGKPVTVSISCGITSLKESDTSPQHLIERADRAMYQAKRAGKDQSIVFSDE